MAVDEQSSNPSANRAFTDILETCLSRRKLLQGGLACAVGSFFFPAPVLSRSDNINNLADNSLHLTKKQGLLQFKPVSITEAQDLWPAISDDYQFQILIPWGTPLQPNGPDFQWPQTAENQLQQLGIGHDGMSFFSLNRKGVNSADNQHGLLVVNHEFGRNSHVLGKMLPENLDEVRASQYAHGVSILELKNEHGIWQRISSPLNRRIHVNTPVEFSGPVSGHALLETASGNNARGTVNNCSSGQTPWGTYLTCEENFNGYFGAMGSWELTPAQMRYGFTRHGFGYGWHNFDARFDLSNKDFHNEENRFGWVVEIDPLQPDSTPVKRTALGRFKHEGVAITVGKDERIVAYMGDDQRFDYIYKFVSSDSWKTMRSKGISPLDEGKLYVAKFNDDNTGQWLELSIENPRLSGHFKDQAEILVFARLAADILGATPMDRPEWTTVADNGDVYCSLTNNSKRSEANAANPMAPNPHGHIIKWHDSYSHIGLNFTWDIFIMARDTHDSEDSFSAPDGLWADQDGRLFIQTDGRQESGMNNQLLVADTRTGEVRRLFTGVPGAELTGMAVTPDRRNLFINIQHPGNGDPGISNFPVEFDGESIPRDATIVISRKNGGVIGS